MEARQSGKDVHEFVEEDQDGANVIKLASSPRAHDGDGKNGSEANTTKDSAEEDDKVFNEDLEKLRDKVKTTIEDDESNRKVNEEEVLELCNMW